MHQQYEKKIPFRVHLQHCQRTIWKRTQKKDNHPQTYFKMHWNNRFWTLQINKLGWQTQPSLFSWRFFPCNLPTLSQAGKEEAGTEAGAALHAAQQRRGCGTASTASPQGYNPGLSSLSHQSAEIHEKPIYLITLPVSYLVDRVIQVKVITAWLLRKGKTPKMVQNLSRILGKIPELVTS